MKFGLVVNPIAGMGGRVGLKGTDGADTVALALAYGATPQSGLRARRALQRLSDRAPNTSLTVAAGDLGANWADGLCLDLAIVDLPAPTGTPEDTRKAVEAMADCDVILFAGGDGTARDVSASTAPNQAILGIPCGVKMHSGVFAVTPETAGAMAADLVLTTDRIAWNDTAEVMDIDEQALREGHIAPVLYGHARVPMQRSRMQAAKGGPRVSSAVALAAAAAEIVGQMDKNTIYIIGPGTSAGAVVEVADQTPTLLGIDVMLEGKVIGSDVNAKQLETLIADRPVRVVLGVTGQQGFLIGRGNQQISPYILARATRDGLVILASEDKLRGLAHPVLWADSGDPELDKTLSGYVRVHTGKGRQTMMRLSAG
ncbi:ATP-NAD kinase family protein [Yoonia algicola]|uniref:NAD(+)/NADH kinase n=1 Tax=Yoonia algicola TaxID=3137368 RepID=A0AAN0NHP3_9RHOB